MGFGGYIFGKSKYKAPTDYVLALDFNQNFNDKSANGIAFTQGTALPTFALSGRKAGEYCAVFNGAQSIKSLTNIPLNSNQATISMVMFTSQSAAAVVAEMSANFGANNAFGVFINDTFPQRIQISDHTPSPNLVNLGNSATNILNGWVHVIMTINRNKTTNQNNIYVNGNQSYIQNASYLNDLNGNFVNNILNIGQRNGASLGFNGKICLFKIYNYEFAADQALNLYNAEK